MRPLAFCTFFHPQLCCTSFCFLNGRESEYRRAVFAVLSFWARYRGLQGAVGTLLFTDCPAFFQLYLADLPVEYILLDTTRRLAMYGPHEYVHRVKIGILDEAMQRYPGQGMLYIDTDTFFVADSTPMLDQLASGIAFMHQPEYTFEEAVALYAGFGQAVYPQRFLQLLATRTFRVGGQECQFRGTQVGWNSGVLGLPPAAADLLPDVYALTDAFYAGSGWFTSEQLAFSLVLPATLPLLRSDQYVFHYWGQSHKQLLDGKLAGLLTPAFGQLALPARLATVQPLTQHWPRQVALRKLQEGALYALEKGRRLSATKYAAKALLKAPLDLPFLRQLALALHP